MHIKHLFPKTRFPPVCAAAFILALALTGCPDPDGTSSGEYADGGTITYVTITSHGGGNGGGGSGGGGGNSSFTVTFDKNGGDTEVSPRTATVAQGSAAGTLPAAPARTGYTFTGWNTAANGSGGAFTASTPVSADITVYAQWVLASYTVTFDKNGGDTEAVPASASATHGGTVPLPTTDPAWSGGAFQGWQTKNGSGGDWSAPFTASTPVTADITVYARWNPPPVYYTVTFDKNGGDTEASPRTMDVAEGSTANPLPAAPARTGYTFAGWNTAANGSGSALSAVTAAVTVYAQWIIKTYTVTFDTNGGDTAASPASLMVSHGASANPLPAAPARTGYTFGAWNTASDGTGTAFTASTVVTGDITVYARWLFISGITGTGPYNGSVTVLYNTGDTRAGTMAQNQAVTLNAAPPAAAGYIVGIKPGSYSAIWIGRASGDDISLNIGTGGVLSFRPADGNGFVPIGSYAEFQLINGALGGSYKQEADLDLLGDNTLTSIAGGVRQNWARIGGYNSTTAFTGVYDGNRKAIDHLYINKTGTSSNDDGRQGLFGYLNGAGCIVKNLSIRSGSVTGYEFVGSIAGGGGGGGATITGCSNAAAVTATHNGAGGLVGLGGTLTACYNAGAVTCNSSIGIAGGLVGIGGPTITACYNTGTVTSSGQSDQVSGGLVGRGNGGTITACYNAGTVTSSSVFAGAYSGGLAGDHPSDVTYSIFTACYNAGSISSNSGIGTVYSAGLVSIVSSSNTTVFATDCYWKAGTGASAYKSYGTRVADWPFGSNPNGDGSFTDPALTPAPSALAGTYPAWGIGAADGTPGNYWKNYTGRNVGGTGYPQLWWE